MSELDTIGQLTLLPELDARPVANSASAGLPTGEDVELDRVQRWILANDPRGERFARVMRESLDQVLDGPRTGRFRYSDLRKTEKTHVGTVIEINLAKEFGFPDGEVTDYKIDEIQVDCKYSMKRTGWEIPREATNHIVLLTWTNDDSSKWSAGLWRVDPRHFNPSNNQDSKRTIGESGRAQIRWLWREAKLDENLLLHLESEKLAKIFSCTGKRTGQKRVNELFRQVQRRIIRREVVLTVAQQKDGPRRARMAREPNQLGREGIIVLGHYLWDVQRAESLELEVPKSGEWISVRVTPVAPGWTGPKFVEEGQYWSIASDDDPVVPAPRLSRGKLLDDD